VAGISTYHFQFWLLIGRNRVEIMISPERLLFPACVFKNRGQNAPKMPTPQQRAQKGLFWKRRSTAGSVPGCAGQLTRRRIYLPDDSWGLRAALGIFTIGVRILQKSS